MLSADQRGDQSEASSNHCVKGHVFGQADMQTRAISDVFASGPSIIIPPCSLSIVTLPDENQDAVNLKL